MTKRITRRSNRAVAVFIGVGLCLILAGVGVQIQLSRIAANAVGSNMAITPYEAPTPEVELFSALPTHLTIPSVGIDVDVVTGHYNEADFSWTLSNDAAVFADLSAPLNNHSGNTYIYGHNKANVFNSLLDVSNGALAHVLGDDGKTYNYQLIKTTVVDPLDLTVLEQTSEPTLTLQTCSGVWYQHRSIFSFRFLGAKS
jgi:LPXTG-site transpeptidase (sortase) family protein